MSRFHQWKGRLQNETEGYPFKNGAPYVVNGAGRYPVEAGGLGPQNGVDDSVAGFPGDVVTFTFTGTATRAMTMGFDVAFVDAAGEEVVVQGTMPIASGDTAAEIATAWAAVLDDRIADTDMTITNPASGQVVLTVVDAEVQIINGRLILYANATAPAAAASAGEDPAPPAPKAKAKKKKPVPQSADDMA